MVDNSLSINSSDVLRKRSLTDEVYDFLSSKIIAGKYSSGDWLRQEDISQQLGVSQTPVREALDRLVASGLAERVPYRGVRVPVLDSKEIVDAFISRLILESEAVRLAASIINPQQVEKLSKLVDRTTRLVSLEDLSTLRQVNKEFHAKLVEAADNPLLSKLYEITTNAFPDWMLYEYMFRHPELLQASLRRELSEHQAIVEALAKNDPQMSSHHVANHIKNLWHDLIAHLDFSQASLDEIEHQIEIIYENQFDHKKGDQNAKR
jgi:DNA-binding GntR family transcriptional regulator